MTTSLLLLPGTHAGDLPPSLVAAADELLAVGDLPRLLRQPRSTTEHLLVAGSPPGEEIGSSLAPVIAAILRPRSVSVIDATAGTVRRHTLARYLTATFPGSILQLGASVAAVALQRVALVAAGSVSPSDGGGTLRRILYARPSGPGSRVGGALTHTHEVIRALRDRGIEVEPITSDPVIAKLAASEAVPPCRWRVEPTGTMLRAAPASAAFAADLAVLRAGLGAARRSDVIYQRHGRFSLAGALLARITGTPLFLEYNGSERYFHDHWQRTPFLGQLTRCENAVLAAATRIFVVSEISGDELAERGIARARIVVNPNGVDVDRFARGGGRALRARLAIPARAVVVGFVGSFGPWHGAPTLARAFAIAAARRPALRLLMVGDGAERAESAAILETAGVGNRSIFTLSIPPAEVASHLDACDVLVAPHVPLPGGVAFFGSPTKLFEYMAAGKAIAASRLGQIGDVLEDDRTALLVEPGDVEQLAHAIDRLAGDRALRSRLGAAARAEAAACHGWEHNAQRIVDAYAALAGSSAGCGSAAG